MYKSGSLDYLNESPPVLVLPFLYETGGAEAPTENFIEINKRSTNYKRSQEKLKEQVQETKKINLRLESTEDVLSCWPYSRPFVVCGLIVQYLS